MLSKENAHDPHKLNVFKFPLKFGFPLLASQAKATEHRNETIPVQ